VAVAVLENTWFVGRVAVVGWQWEWYRWKERIEAVRMVVVRVWQWQY
jgi:hypothetical protein